MIFSAVAAAIALAIAAAGLSSGASQPGSCTTQSVQQTSGDGGSQSNSSTVTQTAQGGDGGAGADGGSASCSSTVQSSNQVSGGSTTQLRGKGAQSTVHPLTERLAARWARRIASGLDATAKGAAPDCRTRGADHVRCSLDWMAESGAAHLAIAFRQTDSGVRWTYHGSVAS